MEKIRPNIDEAIRALTEKPMLATSAERVLILDELKSQYKELPQPMRFSRVLGELLARVSTPIESYDLIAGRCVDRLLTDDEERIFEAFAKSPEHPKRNFWFSSGHGSLSWESIAKIGLSGLIKRAEERLCGETDNDKTVFLTSMIEVYTSIRDYMLRYAEAAEDKGMDALAKRLREAADVPAHFDSALQLLWIVAFIDCAYITENPTLTLGRLDRMLYPFYRADIDSGYLTHESAAELIVDYYCKHNLIMGRGEHQVGDSTNSTTFARICNFDAPQYFLLAGTDEDGKSAVNELTQLMADCIIPQFKNPVFVVRYYVGMAKEHPTLWSTLMKKATESASLMFYNDTNVISTYERIGIPTEYARKYQHFGCNWPGLGEEGIWINIGPSSKRFVPLTEEEKAYLDIPYDKLRVNAPHGWPEDFMIVARELAELEKRGERISIEDLYERFFERMSSFIDRKLLYFEKELSMRQKRPAACLTFTDCFTDYAVQKAECLGASAKYHYGFESFYMFGTTADCFITVDKLVFIDKKLTLSELIEATDNDFEGRENVLAMCRAVDKYGSDTEHSNMHVKRLSETASSLVIEKSRPYLERMGLFLEPCLQSDTWHLKYGETFGATPDGRRANTPFSQNGRPSLGACTGGTTAMLNSMLNVPSNGILSGALNLDIDSKQFSGERGAALLGALLSTYFDMGGLHAQVSSTNAEQLRAAQETPELYKDIRVRVTGYSGVFVDICKRLQDDIINRFEK